MKRFTGILLMALAACGSSKDAPVAPDRPERTADGAPLATLPLVLHSGDGRMHRLTAQVARTPDEQARGLSGRASIRADEAMIFPMFPPRSPSFWMKDTLVPLDIIFVRTDGTIAMIAANAKPGDMTPISTGTPVAGVVELRGGRAKELGLRQGDRVNWGPCTATQVIGQSATSFCPPN
jgi:uncharacterized protein